MTTLTSERFLADLVEWSTHEFAAAPLIRPLLSGPSLRIEEHQSAGAFRLRAELPGIDPDQDIAVTVADGVLTIRANRHQSITESNRIDASAGVFQRSVLLPVSAEVAEVTTSYVAGILEVTVPLAGGDEPESTGLPQPPGEGR